MRFDVSHCCSDSPIYIHAYSACCRNVIILCAVHVHLDYMYLQYNHQYDQDDIQTTQENYIEGILNK